MNQIGHADGISSTKVLPFSLFVHVAFGRVGHTAVTCGSVCVYVYVCYVTL